MTRSLNLIGKSSIALGCLFWVTTAANAQDCEGLSIEVTGSLPRNSDVATVSIVNQLLGIEGIQTKIHFTRLSEGQWRAEAESVLGDISAKAGHTILVFGADDRQNREPIISMQPVSNDNNVAHSVINIIFKNMALASTKDADLQIIKETHQKLDCVVQGRPDVNHEVTGGRVSALTEGLTNVKEGYLLEP